MGLQPSNLPDTKMIIMEVNTDEHIVASIEVKFYAQLLSMAIKW